MNGFAKVFMVGVLGLVSVARASDPVGIYGKVDRVVISPAPVSKALKIQIWGTFSFADLQSGYYKRPVSGVLYYGLPAGEEDITRMAWSDLLTVSGKGNCIGFGGRHSELGTIRTQGTLLSTPPDKVSFPTGVTVVDQPQMYPGCP